MGHIFHNSFLWTRRFSLARVAFQIAMAVDSLPGAAQYTNEQLQIDNWMRRHEFDEALIEEISGMADSVFDVLQLAHEELQLIIASWSPLARIRFEKELKKLGEEFRVAKCCVADVNEVTIAAAPLPTSVATSTVASKAEEAASLTEGAASLNITAGPTAALSCVTRSPGRSVPGALIFSSPTAAHKCHGVCANATHDAVPVAKTESLVSAYERRENALSVPAILLALACSPERPLAASINQPQQEGAGMAEAAPAFPSSSPKAPVQVSTVSQAPSPPLENPPPTQTMGTPIQPTESAPASVHTSPPASIAPAPVPVAAHAHKRIPLSVLPVMESHGANLSTPTSSELVKASVGEYHAKSPHGADGVAMAKEIDESRVQEIPDSMAVGLKRNDSQNSALNHDVSKETGSSETQNQSGELICDALVDRVKLKRRDDTQSKAMCDVSPPNGTKRKRQSTARSSASASKKPAMKRRQQSISVPFVANPDELVDALCGDGWHQINFGDQTLYAPPPQHRLRDDINGLPITTAYDSLLEVAKVTRPQEIVSARFESTASVWTNDGRAWYQCSACDAWREVKRDGTSSLPRVHTCAAYGLSCSVPPREALSRAVTLGDLSIFTCASCKCHVAVWKDDERVGAQRQKCKSCTRSPSKSLQKNGDHALSIARAIVKDPAFQDRRIVFQLENPRSLHVNKKAAVAWAKYRTAGTLRQAVALGAKKTDLAYDLSRKWAWFPGYDIEKHKDANENRAPTLDDEDGEQGHERAHDENDDDTPTVNLSQESKATAAPLKPAVAFGALCFKYRWRAVAGM